MNIRMTLATVLFGAMVSAPALAAPADKLGAEQVKAIAEEGYIYGLPLVMNYAIMNEYAVDKGGSQFKATFNHIRTSRASIPTRTPPSSARTAIRRTRSHGWICVPSPW